LRRLIGTTQLLSGSDQMWPLGLGPLVVVAVLLVAIAMKWIAEVFDRSDGPAPQRTRCEEACGPGP